MLSGNAIIEAVRVGDIEISDFDPKKVGPNSYDLHLGPEICWYERAQILNPRENNPHASLIMDESGYILEAGRLYIGYTVEVAGSRKYAPGLSGVSSIARLGLSVHVTAGFGDVGWVGGQWTLEMVPTHHIRVYPGMRIAQVYFFETLGEGPFYEGKYQGQKGLVPSRSYMDEK